MTPIFVFQFVSSFKLRSRVSHASPGRLQYDPQATGRTYSCGIGNRKMNTSRTMFIAAQTHV